VILASHLVEILVKRLYLIVRNTKLTSHIGFVKVVSVVKFVSLHRVEQSRLTLIAFIEYFEQTYGGVVI